MRTLVASLSLAVATSAGAAPTLNRGPIVVGVGPTEAFITWETSETQANGTVRFGAAAGHYDASVQDPASSENHHVHLTGLLPGQTYHYAIDTDPAGQDSSFTTAPGATGGPFSFVLYGDNRSQTAQHQSVVDAIRKEPGISFLVHTGDMAQNYPLFSGGQEWDTFFAVEHELLRSTPLFPTVGNHETLDTLQHWGEFFAAPSFSWPSNTVTYYSTTWGNAHFVFLDTFESSIPFLDDGVSDAQVEWMKADLDGAKAAGKILFAVMHHGPFSHATGSSAHGGSSIVQTKVLPVLVSRGVRAVFSGHDHIYERGCLSGMDYIVAGGGGAPLYSVDASAAGVVAAKAAYSYTVISVAGAAVTGVTHEVGGGMLDHFAFPTNACPIDGPDAGPAADGGSADAGAVDGGAGGAADGGVAGDGGGAEDGGVQQDGGGGGPGLDAGSADAGGSPGGSIDAGPGDDAGAGPDAGTVDGADAGDPSLGDSDAGSDPGVPPPGGCASAGAATLWLAPLLLALAARRRRRATS